MNKITIKVCIRNTIVNLGKKINSLSELKEEVTKRYFSEQFLIEEANKNKHVQISVALYYEGEEVKDLQALVAKAEEQKKISVKLQAVSCLIQPKDEQINISSQCLDLQDFKDQPSQKYDLNEQSQQILINEKQDYKMSFCSQNQKQISEIKSRSNSKYHFKEDDHNTESDQQICNSIVECQTKSKKYSFENDKIQFDQENQSERYECYQCSQGDRKCKICNGKGYLDQNHKLVKFIDKIFEKKFAKMMQSLNLKPVQNNVVIQDKKIEKMQEKKVQKILNPDDIKIKVKYQNQKFVKKQGEQITWQFQVTNIGEEEVPENVYVRDMKTYKIIDIQGLKVNQSKVIKVGPFQNFEAGLSNVQMFQIFYKVSSEVRYPIGQKFGFVCQIEKKIQRKVIRSLLQQKINTLKEFSECQKSTQNIIMRLKQMGVDQKSIKNFNDEDLIDLIEACK